MARPGAYFCRMGRAGFSFGAGSFRHGGRGADVACRPALCRCPASAGCADAGEIADVSAARRFCFRAMERPCSGDAGSAAGGVSGGAVQRRANSGTAQAASDAGRSSGACSCCGAKRVYADVIRVSCAARRACFLEVAARFCPRFAAACRRDAGGTGLSCGAFAADRFCGTRNGAEPL